MFWIFKKNSKNLSDESLARIDPDAFSIVERLKNDGFETYLVGGCVRDLLLGLNPKDFDIATSASPQKVRNLIPRSFIIGRRFRIVVAKRNSRKTHNRPMFPTPMPSQRIENEFQITTFRREPETNGDNRNENVFGNSKEDAFRRDFTVNGLFLDPTSGRVVDYVQGLRDIDRRLIRMIGNPADRFKEDPIRILRALRFAARTGFKLEDTCEKALAVSVSQLHNAKGERIREEVFKVLKEGVAKTVFEEFDRFRIWPTINPGMEQFKLRNPNLYSQLIAICAAAPLHWHSGIGTGPLLFLLFYSILESKNTDRNEVVAQVADALKVSRAEREELGRISTSLKRLLKTENTDGVFSANPKHIQNLSQTFFCMEALSRAGITPWVDLWKRMGGEWAKFANTIPSKESHRDTPSSGDRHPGPRKRSRRRRRSHGSHGAHSPSHRGGNN